MQAAAIVKAYQRVEQAPQHMRPRPQPKRKRRLTLDDIMREE